MDPERRGSGNRPTPCLGIHFPTSALFQGICLLRRVPSFARKEKRLIVSHETGRRPLQTSILFWYLMWGGQCLVGLAGASKDSTVPVKFPPSTIRQADVTCSSSLYSRSRAVLVTPLKDSRPDDGCLVTEKTRCMRALSEEHDQATWIPGGSTCHRHPFISISSGSTYMPFPLPFHSPNPRDMLHWFFRSIPG